MTQDKQAVEQPASAEHMKVLLDEMVSCAQEEGMHPDRINAFCDSYEQLQAQADKLADVCRAALVLCNSMGLDYNGIPKDKIAYDGKNDFRVSDKLRTALAAYERSKAQDLGEKLQPRV